MCSVPYILYQFVKYSKIQAQDDKKIKNKQILRLLKCCLVYLTTDITCSCLLAAEVSVSKNGNCTDDVCSKYDKSDMAMLLASIEPPGDIGVHARESTSGCDGVHI